MERKIGATTKRPNVWDEFEKFFVHVGDPPMKVRKGKCKMCGKLIAAASLVWFLRWNRRPNRSIPRETEPTKGAVPVLDFGKNEIWLTDKSVRF